MNFLNSVNRQYVARWWTSELICPMAGATGDTRDPDYLRRNALLVLGNVARPTPTVTAVVERYLRHPTAMLRAHAVWVARRLGVAVPDDLADDESLEVRNEVARA